MSHECSEVTGLFNSAQRGRGRQYAEARVAPLADHAAAFSSHDQKDQVVTLAEHPPKSGDDLDASRSGRALDPWRKYSRWLAGIGVVVVAARLPFLQLLTLGDVGALAMTPVWWASARRVRAAVPLFAIGLLCVPVGLLLTERSALDHQLSRGLFFNSAALMVGLLATVGFLLWAREQLGSANVAIAFGVGLFLRIDTSNSLFSSNPWKFGYSTPVTVLSLALLYRWAGRRLELALLIVLSVACLFADSRSALGILMLAAAALAWQLRPRTHNRAGSATRVLLGSSLALVAVYYLAQALVLGGALGSVTQARSQAQVREAGSLIVGGRPELLASLHLIADNPLGPGAGARPNLHEISVAKTAMSRIQYDPNNGYVERFMFGNGYSLHSVVGDLWAQWGLIGLLFVGFCVALVLRRTSVGVALGTVPAITLYLAASLLWNVFFSPWYGSLRLFSLTLALVLVAGSKGDGRVPRSPGRHTGADDPRSPD